MTPVELGEAITSRIEGARATTAYAELTVDVPLARWADAAALCASDPAIDCSFFDWLSAVQETDRCLVVCHLYSPVHRHHVRLRTGTDTAHRVPTLTAVFRGADWHERETYEMFGVEFTGEAHRRPLLLPDGFIGRPLRKDFPLTARLTKPWPGLVEPDGRRG
jgi:NADH-quinone oxidoreductase subunit C